MIHIHEDYYAKPDSIGFSVVKKTQKIDKKGNVVYNTLGYCGNISEVFWLAYKVIAAERLSEKDMELKEAVSILRETKEMIKGMIGEL